MAENTNNINFIKTVFAGEVAKDFPKYNYRLRLAGLTEFEPYISEAPRFEHMGLFLKEHQYQHKESTLKNKNEENMHRKACSLFLHEH